MNLRLILCAFGWHRWFNYCARNSSAERDTHRECDCGTIQWREDQRSPWRSA